MMIFVGLLRGLRRWRSRPTTFERTQQWTRSMVLEKTKKYYHYCYLVSQKGRKIVKNAASAIPPTPPPHPWRPFFDYDESDEAKCILMISAAHSLTVIAAASSFVDLSLTHPPILHTTIIVLLTRALCWAKQDQDRIIHDEGCLPPWYVCCQSDLDFSKNDQLFFLPKYQRWCQLPTFGNFTSKLDRNIARDLTFFNHFCASGKQSNQISRAWSLTSISAYVVRCITFFHIFLKFFPISSFSNNILL